MIIDTKTEKIYAPEGVTVRTTTVDEVFTPADVIASRIELTAQSLQDLQDQKAELEADQSQVIAVQPDPLLDEPIK